MDGATGLQLRVLGELTATRNGAAVDLGGRRQRAVLAALVIERGQAVTTDRLADCVWGPRAPANVSGALQAYVSHLRRRLQPEAEARRRDGVIARAGTGYVLRLDSDAVDAWRFERAVDAATGMAPGDAVHVLDDALRLWHGPAYAEYAGEPWADAEVTRLSELRAVARERLLETRLQLGDAALLVGELEALVAEDPLREERWRLLVLAQYRAHRQADALASLRRARERLAEELGVDPGPALRTLEAEVLAQAPSLAAPATAAPPATVVAAPPPPTPGHSDLVDRSRETELLRRLAEDLGSGSPGCVLIEGPAGIGKSRLLAEAVRLAEARGARVLTGRGSALERSYGFGVVRQLLEASVRDPGERELALQGAASAARAVFDDGAPGDADRQGSFAALHGLYWLTVNLSRTAPLVLGIDDAQLCDHASLRYLAYLVRRLERLPVLVVLTVRTGESGQDDTLLAELALDPFVRVLRPQPLSPEATDALVRERLGQGAASFVAACHRMTSGNPLLLRQLLRALEDEGIRPDVSHVDTVRAVGSRAVAGQVTLRLRRMPPEATAVARAVAVLGDAATLPTVAALAQLSEDRTAVALDALGRSEILLDRQPLQFVHPVVRDAVYHDLPAADRALHHERAVELLRRHGAPPESVAAHVLLAPRRGEPATVGLLRRAALTAMARGASDAAVLLLRRAVAEPVSAEDRAAVLVELGLVETLVDGPAGVSHLAEAYDLLTDPGERARVAMVVVRVQVFASPPGVATEFAAAALAALPEGFGDERQGLLALQRMTGHMHRLPPARYRAGPPPEVTGEGDGARMLAATLCYELLLAGEERARAVELGRFALADDRLLEVDSGLLWIVAANVLQLADDDLGDFWDRALARAYATGGLFAALSANLWRGFTQGRRGELDDALHSLADGTEQQRMWGVSGVTATYGAAFTIGVQVDRGDLVAADAELEAARALPWLGEGGRLLHEAAARLRLAQARPAEALAELTDLVQDCGIANPAWAPWRGLKAQGLAGVGRTEEALALATEEVALLRRWGAPSSLGPALRLLGELRGAEGLDHLREAVAVLSGTRAAVEVARADLALGRAPGLEADEAVARLRAALSTARACGAAQVAGEALAALADRGEAVHDRTAEAPRLTGRDRRILELATSGLDADEVAQRLFLTPGTVRTVLDRDLGART